MAEQTTTPPSDGDETVTLDQLFASYKAGARLGPKTRTMDNYEKSWTAMAASLRASLGREPLTTDLTTESLTAYLASAAKGRGWREQSVRSNASNIRSVVSKSEKRRLLPAGTLLGFELPEVTERDPSFFDEPTLVRIFDTLEGNRTTLNLRLRAFCQIMLDNGGRPEEIAGMNFDDLYEGTSEIRLYGKGRKVRIVPVSRRTWAYLRDYMRVRPAPASASDPVFTDVYTGRLRAAPTTVASDFRDLLVALGVVDPETPRSEEEDGISLYTFRNTFAKRSAEAGMPVTTLAAIMGHAPSSITMLTKRYYKPSEADKRRAHAEARPAEAFHDRRARGDVRADSPTRDLSFFAGCAARPMRTERGNTPSSQPSSRSRTSGA